MVGVSLSELEFLLPGPERASAVSRLASSSVFVGLDARGVEGSSLLLAVNVEGIILPIKVHLFLLDGLEVSVVSFGAGPVGLGFGGAETELRLDVVVGDAIMPSNPTNKLAAGS